MSAFPRLYELGSAELAELRLARGQAAFEQAALTQLRSSSKVTFEACFGVVAEHVQPVAAEEALAWATRYLEIGSGVPDALPGWDLRLRQWLGKVAHRFPKALKSSSKQFQGAAHEVCSFCLAEAGVIEFPEAVLLRIARHFLNAAPGRFAFEGRIELQPVASSCETLLLGERFPILQRARIEQLLPFATDRLRLGLAINYCGQDFRRVGMRLLAELEDKDSATLLNLFQRQPSLSMEGGIVLGLFFAQTGAGVASLPQPVRDALLLDLRSGSLEDADVTETALQRLQSQDAQSLLAETLREIRTTVLIPALASDELVRELLQRLDDGQLDAKLAEEALFRSGAHIAPLLVAFGLEKKRSAVLATVVSHTLGHLGEASGAELLVSWLGHSSKTASVAAKKALERLGESALAALTEGARSAKRELRQLSEQLLGRLALQHPSLSTPLDQVASRAQSLGEVARIEFLERCVSLAEAPQSWSSRLRPLVLRHGAVAVYWLREWFAERVTRHDARLWCYVVGLLVQDADAVWVAVETFALMPKVPTSAWAGPRRELARAGYLLAEPVVHALTNLSSEYREPLYRLLAKHASQPARELLVAGLLDGRKLIRSHCVDGLSRLSDVDPTQILALLPTGGLGTRLAAAELLAVWGRSDTAQAIAEALNVEKTEGVRAYLEEALVACDAAALLFGTASRVGAEFEQAVAAFLGARTLAKVPRFLILQPLPTLRYASGGELSEVAAQAFLGLVMHLDFTWKGRLLRHLRPALDETSLREWSRQVHERWARAKDSRHKWAVLQLWVFGSTETLCSVAESLGRLRPTEHLAVSCYLKALEWHNSSEALSWLFHWWNCLRSRGLRGTARELLGRVAFRRGISFGALVADVDPWIAETAREWASTQPSSLGPFKEQVTSILEQSLTTGRTFPLTLLLGWEQRATGLLRGLVWRVKDASQELPFVHLTRDEVQDVEGNAFLLSEARFRLVHPLEFSAAEQRAWQSRFARATTTPIVTQLARATWLYGAELDLNLSELNTDSARLERWLRREHWFHGQPLDLGTVFTNSKRIHQRGLVVRLQHSGYVIGAHDDVEPVSLQQLTFEDLDGEAVAPEDVDALLYSEVCLSVSQITRPLEES